MKAARFLHKHRALLPPPKYGRLGQPKRWPATITEDIRRLFGKQYDEADPRGDWLARFIQEGTHGQSGERRTGHR